MNISAVFIERPIATSLLMSAIALFGVLAYRALPVSDLPNVDFPTLVVSAQLPGASADTMASSVATPLERQFTGIAGLDAMTSVNSLGSTSVTLQFDLTRDLDGAAVDVETAISAATPLLPPGMPNPPSFRKVNPGDSPVVFLGLTSKTLPLWVLNEYAETVVAQRISTISGVAQVQVMGAQKYAVHVQMDPSKLAAKQIGINEVERAIQGWNANLPTGALNGPHQAFNVLANGQLMNAAGYRRAIVAYRNGSPVYLEELANVIDSVEDDKTASWLYLKADGKMETERAITLLVMRQPNSNTIEVVDSIRRLLTAINAQLPPSVHLSVRGDRAQNIREAFRDIQFTMSLTAGLVILVIFLFLRNASATLIPALALPISLVGTFSIMYVLDFSLNNLSMMALILSIGFVVDDAIVMLENIVRHVERGESALQSAVLGSKEIGFTIVSMTLSLAAVFIPVLFMGGILGRLFREFAVTICAAVLISGVVSITLTPMLCSRLLRPHQEERRGRLNRAMERLLHGMVRVYAGSLHWVLNHRPVMGAVFMIVLAATGWLFVRVPKGFIPDQDTDQMFAQTEAAQGTSYYKMAQLQRQVTDIIAGDPNVVAASSSAGGGSMMGMGGNNSGRMFIQLKPRRERGQSVQQIVEKLRARLGGIPGIRAFVNVPQMIRLSGRPSKSQYEFTVQGPDTQELYREAQKLERELARMDGIQDVSSDLLLRNPRVKVVIDRDKAAALQLNVEQIQAALYSAYGPRWVSTIYAPSNQYRVLLELEPKFQAHADLLSMLYFKTSDGRLAPLDTVAKLTQDAGPQTINHSGQLPSVTISFNLKPGVALGDAVNDIDDLAAQLLPATVTTSFQGTAKAFQSSLKNLGLLLVVAVLVVYIVLGVLYESFVQPLTILSGLPSAVFGALLTLLIFNVDLNIYAFVGLMMLIGIVKKNAIMQIDFALEAERKEGKSPREAIYEGCLVRFRPIMMTTMAALLGTLPMSLGWGAGGEARRPLGLAVVGGLLFSQAITLYLTPVVYTYMAAILERWNRRKHLLVDQPIAAIEN
ncbi:MAG: efflux RND transporter permease subunit [Acidobacteria bacterium]|nr:efflux RND transporter permease subunit [Acidobacteriota bacterium]MBI3470877.1 efflux RND transporter permease subunit [Candidatus Solibacter usitatus]